TRRGSHPRSATCTMRSHQQLMRSHQPVASSSPADQLPPRWASTRTTEGHDAMAWDFSTEPEFQTQLDWVERFCREEIEPFNLVFPAAVRSNHPKIRPMVQALQQQVKDRGLWALFLDEDLGGPGYGQLKLALLNEILGRYPAAPAFFGTAAPDTGNMELLAAYGTDEQKERWLYPLM